MLSMKIDDDDASNVTMRPEIHRYYTGGFFINSMIMSSSRSTQIRQIELHMYITVHV